MRRLLVGLVISLVPVGMVVPASPTTAAPAPPCHAVARRIDAAHTGFSCTTLPSSIGRKWSVTLNGPSSYPLIARGKVFVTTVSGGGWLNALNQSDGSVAWGPVPIAGSGNFSLAYAQGRVFVNDFDGTVRAFNADTGAQLWSTPTEYFSGELVATGGMVWVHGANSAYGLAIDTGEILAHSGYLDGVGSSLAVDSTGVYLSTGCQSQYKLSLTLSVVWFINNGCSGGGAGTAYLWRGLMYGDDGHIVARKDNGDIVGSFAGRPAFMGTTGYFGVSNSVFAQNVTNGVPLWTRTLSGNVVGGPVATSAGVFVATSDSRIVGIDPTTGAVLGSGRLPGPPTQDLAIGDSLIVIPTGSILTALG